MPEMVTLLPPIAEPTPPPPERPRSFSEENSPENWMSFSQRLAKRLENKEAIKKSEPTEKPVTKSISTPDTKAPASEETEDAEKSDRKDEKETEKTEVTDLSAITSEGTVQPPVSLTRPEWLFAQMMGEQGAKIATTETQGKGGAEEKATVQIPAPLKDVGKTLAGLLQDAQKTENSMDSHTEKAETPLLSGVDFPPNEKLNTGVPGGENPASKRANHPSDPSPLSPSVNENGEAKGQAKSEGLPVPSPTAERLNEQLLRANAKVDGKANGGTTEGKAVQAALSSPVPETPANVAQTANFAVAEKVGSTGIEEEKPAFSQSQKEEPSRLASAASLVAAGKVVSRPAEKSNSGEQETPQEPDSENAEDGANALSLTQAVPKHNEDVEGTTRPQDFVVSSLHRTDAAVQTKNVAHPSPDPDRATLITQVQKHTERMVAIRGSGEIDIRLTPEHLGTLHIRIVKDGENVMARISAENQQVKQVLESGQQDLRDALKERGLNLATLEFKAGTNSSANGAGGQFSNTFAQSDPNAQRHFSNQSSLRPGYGNEKDLAPMQTPALQAERNQDGRLDFRA